MLERVEIVGNNDYAGNYERLEYLLVFGLPKNCAEKLERLAYAGVYAPPSQDGFLILDPLFSILDH